MRRTNSCHALQILVLLGVGLGLCACRSAPPAITYYTLDPLSLETASVQASAGITPLTVGIGPVSLPTYLERTQIVTRSGDHTLAVNDFHRWAGPLDEEILRVLVVSVGKALPGAEVLPYPWGHRTDPTHQVRLALQRFDGQIGGQVHLRGTWHLICHSDPDKRVGRTFDISEAVTAPGMTGLVDAQNRALGKLAEQMVAVLCAVP